MDTETTSTVIETLNGVEILRNADGTYALRDLHANVVSRPYRRLEGARNTAVLMAKENDRIDAYERSI